ncbi:lytic transglycosylase domain-containing protein [Sphingomonas lacunae]|nr:transglycosylase SLT domain-containing protein [Sphingomonas lacunae]
MAALLLTPTMCMASELQPEQRAWYASRIAAAPAVPAPAMPHAAAEAVIEWQALTRVQRPSFDRVAAFLMANPGWPNEAELKRAAEAALDSGGFIPASATAYFDRFTPTNAAGHLRHALALRTANRMDEANAAARRAWTSGVLNADEESRLLSFFPGALSQADQDARMERLLWSGSTTAATRQIALVSPERRLEFQARLAMRSRATGAALRAAEAEAADPALARTNAGYLFDKATWLAASGQAGAARALLAGPRTLAVPPLDPEKWLELIVEQARGAQRAGDNATAYNIARQVDDALPLGTVVVEQGLGVRDEYTNALWLAANIALKQLGRPREAVGLFALYSTGGRSPQVQARGLYWAGRAAMAANDLTLANDYFGRAARHFDQFHGQLALERLGQAQPRPASADPVSYSQAERAAFEDSSLVRAARVLGEIGAWRDQSLFLRAIANNARSDADHYFAARLSGEIGRPDLAVMVGRSARVNGLDDYVPTAFPILNVPPGHEDNWTFIHAITRQESQFDKAAMSRVGARGLMQLMPGTAAEQARLLGLGYNLSALTSDTQYNMMLGSAFFQRMVRYYNGSYPLAVAAYNAGPGNVNRWLVANGDPRTGSVDILDWIEAIPFTETRNYVQRVMENAVVYETMRPNAPQGQRNLLSTYLGKSTPG